MMCCSTSFGNPLSWENSPPEEANRIGYELALAFTKGNHAFIVTTHEDKEHIHSHIYFNSTSVDYTRKFRNFWGSSRAIRRISDRICIENGLSIIENPKPPKGHYGTWLVGAEIRNRIACVFQDAPARHASRLGEEKTVTWQEKLRHAIDRVLSEKPSDITAFIEAMKAAGYEVKQGKLLKFRAPGQTNFTKLRSLGADYTYEAILERIVGKRIVAPERDNLVLLEETTIIREAPKFNLLIDIQNSIKAKNSPGYEQWAKVLT